MLYNLLKCKLKKIDYSYQALVIQKVLVSKPENIIILFLFYILWNEVNVMSFSLNSKIGPI